jgi:hypothetical protein
MLTSREVLALVLISFIGRCIQYKGYPLATLYSHLRDNVRTTVTAALLSILRKPWEASSFDGHPLRPHYNERCLPSHRNVLKPPAIDQIITVRIIHLLEKVVLCREIDLLEWSSAHTDVFLPIEMFLNHRQ